MITEDLEKLCVLKKELRAANKKYRESVKPIKDEIALLEASVRDAVLKSGHSIQVGDIKAEIMTTVVFKMRKEQVNE